MAELGYIEGKNVEYIYYTRSTGNDEKDIGSA